MLNTEKNEMNTDTGKDVKLNLINPPSTSTVEDKTSPTGIKLTEQGAHKISSHDITVFCGQLEDFVTRAQKFRKYITKYPLSLHERLNNDIKNLEFLFIETQETVNNIQRIKTQHKYVKKDTTHAEKLLRKFKDEEVQEMEKKISTCDENMFKGWETIKKSLNIQTVEKFMIELQDKLTILETLKTLVTQKLIDIRQSHHPLMIQFNTSGGKPKDKPVKNLIYESRRLSRPTRPNKKRKHQDRNDIYVPIQDSVPSLQPLPHANPIALILNRSTGINYSTSHSTVKTVSNHSLSPTQTNSTFSGTESSYQDEMQSVLQALFGEIKQNSNKNEQSGEEIMEDTEINGPEGELDFFKRDSNFQIY